MTWSVITGEAHFLSYNLINIYPRGNNVERSKKKSGVRESLVACGGKNGVRSDHE
jgi:hypothetical protein